ncbi:MAG: hypothetical protein KA153_03885 [Hyphomonadaceae bacterium]|nr:hypothetical protein [Hyphomonadaceae bacterium]
MWRTPLVATLLWCAFATSAHACLGTNFHRGVIYDDIPWDTPPDSLVLRVEFDRGDVRRIAGPRTTDPMNEWLLMERIAVEARVIEVVRGSYNQPTVSVAIGGSSCDSPFIFGRRGLILGSFVAPTEGQARYDAAVADQPGALAFSWPFNETIFDAMTETRDDRDLRHAGLARADGGPFISGDYDGDDRIDTARFFEDAEGALHIGVQFGARRQDQVERIWSADSASFPYFTFSTTPAGTYRRVPSLYDETSSVPREVTLAHDAIIVTALEGPADFLYYWDGSTFRNMVISE